MAEKTMTLSDLQNQLSGYEPYARKTDDELRAQAENLYQIQYENDMRDLQRAIEQNVAEQNRSMIDRGMQRSSYGMANEALIRSKGMESKADLGAAYEQNVANALYQLIAGEDDNQKQADQYRNQLLMALYEYGLKSGGGSGSGSGGAKTSTDVEPAPVSGDIPDLFGLNGTKTAVATNPVNVGKLKNLTKKTTTNKVPEMPSAFYADNKNYKNTGIFSKQHYVV